MNMDTHSFLRLSAHNRIDDLTNMVAHPQVDDPFPHLTNVQVAIWMVYHFFRHTHIIILLVKNLLNYHHVSLFTGLVKGKIYRKAP